MIRLVTRKEMVSSKRIVGSELAKLQKAFFDNNMLDYYKADNEEQLYLDRFDCIHNEVLGYPVFDKVLSLNHHEIETFIPILAKKLRDLLENIQAQHLLLITHLKLDLLKNRQISKGRLGKSYKKLEKIINKKSYNEAIVFDLDSLPDMIEIVFWITRCDPSAAEYILFFDTDEKVQFTVCKYGNVHLTEFRQENLSAEKLTALGWHILSGQEVDNFSKSSKTT